MVADDLKAHNASTSLVDKRAKLEALEIKTRATGISLLSLYATC